MGQGYSLTSLSAGSATIDVPELSDLEFEKSLGNARFMKCIRARRKDGLVVAKIVMKPSPNTKWDEYVQELNIERKELSDIPNALGYHRIQQTGMAGYLVRQYIHSSLYDRMSTRPFLDPIEKKWLAFQLLCAVRDCHGKNLYHGDIKTENILVTSWNWLFLTDFSSAYKPTYLPEDNPADFNFFFDTSSSSSARRTCYLAPERFLRPGEDYAGKSKLNWAMDIFSVGCVIAELFMETPIFSLAQLFKYRSREYDPSAHLDNIKDKDIREMVAHMIQLDPQDRYSAEEYLNFWKQRAFPDYFYSFLHQYMNLITDPTSGRRPVTAGQENLGEADDRIDRVYLDFDKVAFFLGFENGQKTEQDQKPAPGPRVSLFPLQIDIPNNRHQASKSIHKPLDNGCLLFLTLVEASVRSTARATARLRAIELMLAFAERVPDEVKLDRILPFYMELLSDDQTEAVKVATLRAITQLLELVYTLTAVNAYVFPEYILLRLTTHVLSPKKNPSTWLRATYASCLSSLAATASRFLDMMQALRSEGSLAGGSSQSEVGKLTSSSYHYHNLYDSARSDLMAQFELHTTALLTDTDTSVRRAFLGSISSLCVFFGSTRASDVILSHLNTYLNDRDWELKCAFFETIVGVATYVGGPSLEEFILPLMVQSLTDPEETVIERVLRSFSAIAGLGLFQRSTTWELVDIVGRFSMHPNTWIREAAVEFISAASKYLTVADRHGIIIPLIKAYLITLPSDLSELVLLDVLKKPMPRLVFDMALTWSLKTEKGVFWKAAQLQRTFTFGAGDHNLPTVSGQNLGPRAFNRIPKNEEDEQWIQRLRNAGMEHGDEFKLVCLREFIWRVAHRRSQLDAGSTPSQLNTVIQLSSVKATMNNVVFDQDPDKYKQTVRRQNRDNQRDRTIAEALQDATSQPCKSPVNQDGGRASPLEPISVTVTSRPSASHDPNSDLQTPAGLDVPRSKSALSPMSGTTVASSIDSKASFRLTDHNHPITRKGSAMNLMSRAEAGGKAVAELGFTQETAFGQVAAGASGREEKRALNLAPPKDPSPRNPPRTKHQAAHNYSGNDPTVLRLLDSLYLDTYPIDHVEFGPIVSHHKRPIKRAGGQAPTGPWRPDGNLVAYLGEHTAAINRVVVAVDHAFFITGADDGMVKVWDTSRLERNTTHRARHTFKHAPGARVTSLTFIEGTHCFVTTGSDSSVNIVRVEIHQKHDDSSQSSPRYGKLRTLREYKLPNGEYSVWCEHFKEGTTSVLILVTNKCRIVALELRTMEEIYVLSNPLHHGTPLCFCVDKKHHWLLVGTSHGILDLWDLRFRLRLKAWGFPAGSPIHRISLVPSKSGRQHKVAIAGGTGQGEVTIWDMEKVLCTNVYRTGLSKESIKGYKLVESDEERPGGMLGRLATSSEPSSNAGMDRGIRAIAMGLHVVEGSDPRFYFFVSAGPDWKVRFWDSNRHESSMVVSGMELEEGRPSYSVSQPSHDLTVVSETLSPPPPISGSSTANTPVASPARGGMAASAGKRPGRDKARSSIISMQQQHLLKSHLDTVTDVALLESPYGMVVSVDRSGSIYVFS
ncbi:hypothetical protein FKW77_003947 [Venturia effusa]|uniref:non-specific serine/threonine protein kinase n=1 Tax=Venturia effusa TaxID=50376 RepID=A0A517LCC1_9PEZI|nr:hypothetical protein FKW77_003947 [Venturia effusa]